MADKSDFLSLVNKIKLFILRPLIGSRPNPYTVCKVNLRPNIRMLILKNPQRISR